MLTYILLTALLLVVVLAVVISMRPSTFNVSRSAKISAPANIVFNQVNILKNWEHWSPWAKVDPDMTQRYEGPEAGVGAKYYWSGNNKVGEGINTITESIPDQLITMQLEFLKPFKGTNQVEFTFTPQGNATDVHWSMSGKTNFMGKAIGLFMNCEKIVGEQYEQGLATLKQIAENLNTSQPLERNPIT